MTDEKMLAYLRVKYPGEGRDNFNFSDFLHAEGSPATAILYARLFWPQFVEIDGMIFLKDTMEDEEDIKRLRKAIEKHGGVREAVERSFNFVEIPPLFGGRSGETEDEEDYWLASQLAEMWAIRLKTVFPQRHFEVKVLAASETGNELGIEFYQT